MRVNIVQFILIFLVGHFGHAQIISDSVLIENHYRIFHYNTPKDINGLALIFALHGSGSNGKDYRKQALKLEELALQENFILVYPDGYKKFWNECRTASPAEANKENINEEAFFIAMIHHFKTKYKVDEHKIFVIGTSGGGHMAYKLALNIPEKFRAITAIIANLPDTNNLDCVPVNKAIPVMIINGTEDKVNPYQGGEVNIGFSLGTVRSTDRTFQYWAHLAGHTGQPMKKMLADTDPSDNKTIEQYSYFEKNKPDIVLLKVIGGKHDYPNDINVFLEAWSFFKKTLQK